MQLIVWLISFSIYSSIFCIGDLNNEVKSEDKASALYDSSSESRESNSEGFDSNSGSVETVDKQDSDAEENEDYTDFKSKEQNEIEFKIDPRTCLGNSNSSKLSCQSQCGECMQYCKAKNLKKKSSDCKNGKNCCVLTRRQK